MSLFHDDGTRRNLRSPRSVAQDRRMEHERMGKSSRDNAPSSERRENREQRLLAVDKPLNEMSSAELSQVFTNLTEDELYAALIRDSSDWNDRVMRMFGIVVATRLQMMAARRPSLPPTYDGHSYD